MTEPRLGCPDLGVGAGLRTPHYRYIFEEEPENVGFFEIISENFMVEGGAPIYNLNKALERYPLVQHGVSMGIGGPTDPDRAYLERLKKLHQRVKGPWLSDHFCWTSAAGVDLHDLLPLPANEQTALLVAERAHRVQDFLEVRFALENASSYMAFHDSSMPEWEFVSMVAERGDIGLMFDVNNVYVAAYNHGFDPFEYVSNVPHERIVQIHIAGHTNYGEYILDTHHGKIIDEVWELYRYTIELTGPVSTIIEWDSDIPDFPVVMELIADIAKVRDEATAARQARVAAGKDPKPPRRSGAIPTHRPQARDPHPIWSRHGGVRELPSERLAE